MLFFSVDDIHITMKNVKLTDDEDEEPYVKVHPDRKRMDVDDDSTPTGVCFLHIMLLVIVMFSNNLYLNIYVYRFILWDQILKVMHSY